MLTKIYNEGERTFGRIFYDAKCRMIQQGFPIDSLYGTAVVYTAFGDPALRIKYGVIPGVSEKKSHQDEKPLFSPLGTYLKIPASGKITVYNMLGEVVIKNLRVKKGMQINLKTGVYFVLFESQETKKLEKVVIIE
jgi:hypothetical protein